MKPTMRYFGLLCATLLLFASVDARAQGVEVGVRAGGTYANVYGNTEVITHGGVFDAEARQSIHVAAFASVPLNDVIAFRPELLYIEKGAAVEGTRPFATESGSPSEINDEYKFSYLQLPLLLEARVPVAGNFNTYLLLGPSVGTNLQASIDRSEDANTEGIPESSIRTLDVGLVGGLELGYDVQGAGSITLGAHYDLGLTQPVSDDDTAAEQGKEADFRNGALMLSLGYRFGL